MTMTAPRNRKSGLPARRTAPTGAARFEHNPELIRCRAYEIFLGRNGRPGDPLSDWVQAERELRGESRGSPAPVRPAEHDSIRGASGVGPGPRNERLASIHD
jgi:hypothetical protein